MSKEYARMAKMLAFRSALLKHNVVVKSNPLTRMAFQNLGMARTAEVKRDARIGEADAKRDAQIKEAIAEEERMAARLLNDGEIAKSKRDFELKKAAYDVEVHTKVKIKQI